MQLKSPVQVCAKLKEFCAFRVFNKCVSYYKCCLKVIYRSLGFFCLFLVIKMILLQENAKNIRIFFPLEQQCPLVQLDFLMLHTYVAKLNFVCLFYHVQIYCFVASMFILLLCLFKYFCFYIVVLGLQLGNRCKMSHRLLCKHMLVWQKRISLK